MNHSYKNRQAYMFSKPPAMTTAARQPSELATVVDLGLSDDEIAGCFDVEPVKVSRLHAYYELAKN